MPDFYRFSLQGSMLTIRPFPVGIHFGIFKENLLFLCQIRYILFKSLCSAQDGDPLGPSKFSGKGG